MTFTIGSLFDGSGGFNLAAFLCGGVPVFASEIEPYPIAVTKSRFPYVKHLGDISRINGAEIEPVDVITFGSPCQDLSVAGKRAGLKHEANGDEETTRSGLFMEAVRIIKEMRDATNGKYPRFALWENVPGAFSSNKGEDFRIVLEELIKIVEPGATMPAVPKKGWPYADSYVGDGWSLTYRVFDAQYWGVPQRRRRIHLVLDLGGERAREILFEREGVRGYFTQGRSPWQGTAIDSEGSIGADDSQRDGFVAYSIENHPADSRVSIDESGKVQTLTSRMGTGGGNVPMVMETMPVYCLQGNGIDRADTAGCNGRGWNDETCYTLNTIDRPAIAYCMTTGSYMRVEKEVSPTLLARDYKDPNTLVYWDGSQTAGTLTANNAGGNQRMPDKENFNCVVDCGQYIVRRLTPTECARLQGFPDRWGDIDPKEDFTEEEYQFWLNVRNTHAEINGKQVKEYTKAQMLTWYNKLHTDSAEYKMWGNGIALPPALYCMQGIAEALKS